MLLILVRQSLGETTVNAECQEEPDSSVLSVRVPHGCAYDSALHPVVKLLQPLLSEEVSTRRRGNVIQARSSEYCRALASTGAGAGSDYRSRTNLNVELADDVHFDGPNGTRTNRPST